MGDAQYKPFVFNAQSLVYLLHFFRTHAVERQFRGQTMTSWIEKTMAAAGLMAAMTVAGQAQTRRVIVVSLEDKKLALVEDGAVKKVYSVAVGKPSTPSPAGTFRIERRVMNPVYHHNGHTVEPGPQNPVGTRWMGLNVKGYGIHGTNEPKSIGKAASHGCIRMAKADLEELYALVQVGDTVELVGTRDEETAELFGEKPVVMQAALPVMTAENAAPAADATAVVETMMAPAEIAMH